jgi:hypothetical protein
VTPGKGTVLENIRKWLGSGKTKTAPPSTGTRTKYVWPETRPPAEKVALENKRIPTDNGSTRYVEEMAARLIELYGSPGGVSAHLREIRAIGERLNDRGGNDRMRDVTDELRAAHGGRDLERAIERAWDGIGRWQA